MEDYQHMYSVYKIVETSTIPSKHPSQYYDNKKSGNDEFDPSSIICLHTADTP